MRSCSMSRIFIALWPGFPARVRGACRVDHLSIGTRGGQGLSIAEMLRDGAQLLAEADIDNPRLEARLLLAHATGRTSEDLIPRSDSAGWPIPISPL